MHPRTTTAVLLAAAGLLLTGCGGHSSHDKTAATPTKPATTTTPAASPSHAAKLSTTWLPKLDAHSKGDGDGVAACQQPSATDCVTALTSDVNLLSAILNDITATNANGYPKTVAQIQKMVSAAQKFSTDQCPNNPAADADNSPCYGDAVAVTVGMPTLQFVMQTDELDHGAK